MKKYLLDKASFCFLLVASYWSIAPLFIQGFFPIHDNTQVARVQQMAKALRDGMFPVRWVPDLGYGYGYPIFSFYGPFSYYIGACFMFFGADALLATKLMMVVGVLASGIGMYYLAKLFWGRGGATIAAILYVYAPYHAVNIYVRGAVNEFFGYACTPFVFYGVIKAYQERKFRYVVVAGASYAVLIMSHNLTALMVTPFLVLLLLLLTGFSLKKEQKLSFYFIYSSLFFGLALSAFYWIPALFEMSYTNVISQVGGAADFREHYICLAQLWESPWGFGGSSRGCVDGLSFRVGKIHIILAGLSVLLMPLLYKKEKKQALVILTGFFFFLISVFFSLDYSKIIWKAVPILSFIQYPWRFLSMISFFASFLGGAVTWVLFEKIHFVKNRLYLQVGIIFASVVVIVLFYARLFVPQTIIPKTARDFVNQNTLRFETSRISDEYLPPGFARPFTEATVPSKKFAVISGIAVISGERQKTQQDSIIVRAETPTVLHLNIAYFPAWEIFIDGKQSTYKTEKNGLSVDVPKGTHEVEAKYVSTGTEKIANLISIIGILGLVTGIIFFKRKGVL